MNDRKFTNLLLNGVVEYQYAGDCQCYETQAKAHRAKVRAALAGGRSDE